MIGRDPEVPDPRPTPGDLLHRLIDSARLRKPFNAHGYTLSGDGTAERDYIDVRDVAKLIARPTPYETMPWTCNLCTGRPVSVLEMVHVVEEQLKTKLDVAIGNPPPGVVGRAVGMKAEMDDMLGTPLVPIRLWDSVKSVLTPSPDMV